MQILDGKALGKEIQEEVKLEVEKLSKKPHLAVILAGAYSAGDAGLIPGSEDPLEEEMATRSSMLGWRIPWTEEPGGLQSMGS